MARRQYWTMRLEHYPVSDGIAKMCRDLASLPHAHPNQVRTSSLGMGKDTLCGVSKVDYEFSRASRIDVRRKDALHLFAQRLCQGLGIRVRGGLNRQDVKQGERCPVFRRQGSQVWKYRLGFIGKIGGKQDVLDVGSLHRSLGNVGTDRERRTRQVAEQVFSHRAH